MTPLPPLANLLAIRDEAPRARFESLAARLQSAPHSLHEFPGDFGFLHFGPQGDVTAVRSCGGLVLVYRGVNGTNRPGGHLWQRRT